jgi:diguanylate cyclase (GGDEF)-like protein
MSEAGNATSWRVLGSSRAKRLRVLVAESGGGKIAHLLESLYSTGTDSLELACVSSEVVLAPTIRLVAPEVIFLDLALFRSEPLAAVRELRRVAAGTPLIMLASLADKEIAEQSLQEGAMNYVLKEHADERAMERVLRGALERNTVAGLTELLRDPQTDVYNREGFMALAQRAVHAAQKSRGQLVLLKAKLENYAALGLEFGPSAAEQGLKDAARLLEGAFRRTDVVARIGESEFAVLAMDAAAPSAAVMVQRVEKHLEALNQARAPWGDLVLRLDARFWSARESTEPPDLIASGSDAQETLWGQSEFESQEEAAG